MNRLFVTKPRPGIRLNKGHNLARGLLGYWLFNEGSGLKAYDVTGNNNTGTLTSSPLWRGSQFGGGMYFDGATGGGYIDLGTIPMFNLTASPLTISAWVRIDESSTTTRYIVGDFNSGATISSMLLDAAGSPRTFRFGSTGFTVGGTTTPQIGVWYHVVGVKAGSIGAWVLQIYVNGVQEVSTATALNPGSQQQLSIGKAGAIASGFRWQGIIDEVRIYNRALTQLEVQQLYTNPHADLQFPKYLRA